MCADQRLTSSVTVKTRTPRGDLAQRLAGLSHSEHRQWQGIILTVLMHDFALRSMPSAMNSSAVQALYTTFMPDGVTLEKPQSRIW